MLDLLSSFPFFFKKKAIAFFINKKVEKCSFFCVELKPMQTLCRNVGSANVLVAEVEGNARRLAGEHLKYGAIEEVDVQSGGCVLLRYAQAPVTP